MIDMSALYYDVALGILAGEIKWLNRPYHCKDCPVIYIFGRMMKEHELNKRVEADESYPDQSQLVTKVPSAF